MLKSKITKPLRNQSGMSFAELTIGALVMALTAQAVLSGVEFLNKRHRRFKMMTAEDRQITSLISSIRLNLHKFQVDSVPVGQVVEVDKNGNIVPGATDETDSVDFGGFKLNAGNLPIAWSEFTLTEASECEECPGRLGYVIQPYQGYGGLYRVWLRLTNKALFGSNAPKDITFVVNMK